MKLGQRLENNYSDISVMNNNLMKENEILKLELNTLEYKWMNSNSNISKSFDKRIKQNLQD